MASRDWDGRKYTDIVGGDDIGRAPQFPRISLGYNTYDKYHTVLYEVENYYGIPPKPFRNTPRQIWNNDYVKMPFDVHSTCTVYEEDNKPKVVPRWQVIERALKGPMRNTDELIDAILSYNEKYRGEWHFRALRTYIDSWSPEEREYFFTYTLKAMAERALKLIELIQAPIPLLKQTDNQTCFVQRSVSLSQEQISSILTNAFFCTFPNKSPTKKRDKYGTYPYINFSRIFESTATDEVMGKLYCLLNYFHRVTITAVPNGVVTFVRQYVSYNDLPAWNYSNVPVKDLLLHVDCKTSIQDAWGLIQVDFANEYIGGEVLGEAAEHEEIMFTTSPDLMASMLFTEPLGDNEAVLIIGSERYSQYTGYGSSFRFVGDYEDRTPFDSYGRRHRAVLAIDAKPYSYRAQELNDNNIQRELNKAYIGFSFFGNNEGRNKLNFPGVATGNWGCGTFGGSKSIKCLIQMMASVQAKRPLAYFTLHDRELMESIMDVYTTVSDYNITVGELYHYIIVNTASDSKGDLRSFSHGISGSHHGRRNRRPREIASLTDDEAKEEEESTTASSTLTRTYDSNDSTESDKVEAFVP